VCLITAYTIAYWRHQRLIYFVLLSIAGFFYVLGYCFEITSTTLDGAMMGIRVNYLGASFIGVFIYLFSRDYQGRPKIDVWIRNLLIAVAAFFTLSVFVYPWLSIHYVDVEYHSEGMLHYVSIKTPGVTYYPGFIYVGALTIMAAYSMLRHFFQERRYEGAVFLFLAVVLPLIIQALTLARVIPEAFNAMPTSLTVAHVLLFIYLQRYRQREWQSTGRDFVVENMRDAFILIDQQGRLLDYNIQARRFFPHLDEVRVGASLDAVDGFPIESLNAENGYQFEHPVDGRTLNLLISNSSISSGGVLTGTSIIIADDTESHRMMLDLVRLARIDELTGLNNRATYYHEAALSFGLVRRHRGDNGCALMMDIDFFKNINDSYGHAVGDDVLRFIGALLLKRLRHTDICGRYGGEELCVWMPSTQLLGAKRVANEIRSLVETHYFMVDERHFSITLSIGIASVLESSPNDFDDLMKKADIALYEAKGTGRNRVCIYDA
jgi:diguanylate cyclase (GGDEF)-like protein